MRPMNPTRFANTVGRYFVFAQRRPAFVWSDDFYSREISPKAQTRLRSSNE